MAGRIGGAAVALALTLALDACASAPAGAGPDLVLLCPGDRAVGVSFLRQGTAVLLASGPDRLVLPRLPDAPGLAYGDGRAAFTLGTGTAIMAIAARRRAAMVCRIEPPPRGP